MADFIVLVLSIVWLIVMYGLIIAYFPVLLTIYLGTIAVSVILTILAFIVDCIL